MRHTASRRLTRRGAGSDKTADNRNLDTDPAMKPTARPHIGAGRALEGESVLHSAHTLAPLRLSKRWLRGRRPSPVMSRAAFGTGVGWGCDEVCCRNVL
jgi:hypothetical protein